MTTQSQGAKPILLAFSGGLDTSFCVPWLKETYQRPVITVTVDTGGIDAAAAKTLASRARELGASEHYLVPAKTAYFERVLRYLLIGNARRGQLYPFCVGAERVLQAQMIAEMAKSLGSTAVAHGCTAAGNDQVRFEVAPCARWHQDWKSSRRSATVRSSAPNSSPSWRNASYLCRRTAPRIRSTAACGA